MSKVPLRNIVIGLLVFLPAALLSQNTDQILEVGNEYYQKGDYLGAKEVYEQALLVDSSDAAVLYHYSRSLMQLMQMKLASRYLFKASLIDRGENFPDVYFLLAESYRNSGDYRKARRNYNKAIIPYRSDRNSYWYKRIKQSKDANSWAMKQPLLKDQKLSPFDSQFNTDASEFGARIINSQLYFSSLRADSLKEGDVVEDQSYFNKIYHSDLNKKLPAVELAVSKKLKNKHLANFSLSEDGKYAFFSVCDTNFNCEIWSAQLKDNSLLEAKALNKNINFPSYNNTQGEIINYNGKTYLLFSSNRPKGFGGMDLWIAEQKDFGFDEAINLGGSINTPDDEITPYYQDGWLYFSSNWHLGFGGFDIYKTSGWLSNYSDVENLGSPINSASDDYYFSRSADQAIFSSNRSESGNKSYCCNDLYYLPYDEELLELDTISVDTVVPDILTLNKYLPLDLYFHNDVPDPNSKDSTTSSNYLELAKEYQSLKNEYLEKLSNHDLYVKDEELPIEVESFFENELNSGIEDLEFFTPLLKKALDNGSQIELSIKGFASSISGAEYNLKLTLRRIESLINYLKAYDNGALLPYFNGVAENGGSLKINKIPFGEFAISDKSLDNDKVLAVYSPKAALQRKIELIAVSNQNGESKRFDSNEDYSVPEIKFNSKSYDLGEIDLKEFTSSFKIKNEGGSKLEIYNVMINCECASIEFPTTLESDEEGIIRIEVITDTMEGEIELVVTVVSNALPNLENLRIRLIK